MLCISMVAENHAAGAMHAVVTIHSVVTVVKLVDITRQVVFPIVRLRMVFLVLSFCSTGFLERQNGVALDFNRFERRR